MSSTPAPHTLLHSPFTLSPLTHATVAISTSSGGRLSFTPAPPTPPSHTSPHPAPLTQATVAISTSSGGRRSFVFTMSPALSAVMAARRHSLRRT